MLFRDKNSFDKLNNALSQLKNITPYCYECTPYLEAIHSLFAINEKSDSLVNDLQLIGIRLEEVTDKIARHERQKIGAFLTKTQRLLVVALVFLCILGPYSYMQLPLI